MKQLFSYFSWHYGDGFRMVRKNAVIRVFGFLNYFSVLQHLATLFSPWHRVTESYGRGFMFTKFLTTLIVNLFSRIVGAIVRLVVILMGLLVSFTAALFGIAAVLMWLIAPAAVPILFLLGAIVAFT